MNILEIKNLTISMPCAGNRYSVVDDVSFSVGRGEVFGLVGGSGSGKTMTALSILNLLPAGGLLRNGSVRFDGDELIGIEEERMRDIRGRRVAIVFQEPSSALNPVFTVGSQITEAILAHRNIDDRSAVDIAIDYLKRVHVPEPERVYKSFPHQLSGGTKQRALIAMALVNSPELLILDEPTSALDVTVQARILELLEEIIEREKLSMLFISHDMGVVSRMCSRVAVMHKGKIVEEAGRAEIFGNPKDAYTRSLLEAVRALE